MWTAFDTLWLVLCISWIFIFTVFMFVFERIGKHERDLIYYADGLRNFRTDFNDLWRKMEHLYERDEHKFERPRIDLLKESMERNFARTWESIGELLEEKRKKK